MTELTDDELARALRAARPAPTPHFARRLDAWAADGFQRSDPSRPRDASRRRRRRLPRPAMGVAAALAALALGVTVLPAIPNGTDDEGEVTSVSGGAESSGGSGAAAPPGAQDQALPAPPSREELRRTGRSVEREATLALATEPGGLEEVAAGIARVTDAARGYVATSTIDARSGGGTAEFELRVPSRRLTATLARLSELADVRARSQSSVDVTRILSSAAERLEEAQARRRGLLRRIARDGGDEAVRAQLRRVNARLAAAKGDVASVRRRADLARVSVSVAVDPASGGAGTPGRWTPGDALRDAVRVLEVAAGIALIAAAVGLPLALVGAPLLMAGRRRRRHGRERALDAM